MILFFKRFGFATMLSLSLLGGPALARDSGPVPSPGSVFHIVKADESPRQIARLYGVSEETLLSINGQEAFWAGGAVEIPPADSGWPVHRVESGQTLWRIGAGYGISVEQLMQANQLTHTNLEPGQQLRIPRARKPAWVPPARADAQPPAAAPIRTVAEPAQPTALAQPSEAAPIVGWIEVRLPDNSRAWVRAEDLVIGSWKPRGRADLVETARAFVGTPYKWGGTNPNGYDCSGYVQEVFRLAGHSVPRMADVQYEELQKVEKDSLEPGDLVFFNTDGSGVSHVGIYTGEGRFLHASSSKGVVESELSQSYYAERYVGGARIEEWEVGEKKEPSSRFEDD